MTTNQHLQTAQSSCCVTKCSRLTFLIWDGQWIILCIPSCYENVCLWPSVSIPYALHPPSQSQLYVLSSPTPLFILACTFPLSLSSFIHIQIKTVLPTLVYSSLFAATIFSSSYSLISPPRAAHHKSLHPFCPWQILVHMLLCITCFSKPSPSVCFLHAFRPPPKSHSLLPPL